RHPPMRNQNQSLGGRVIIQFGGTGLLGRALVSSLLGAGATLIVASRNSDCLQALTKTENEIGRSLQIEEVDIKSEAYLHHLRDRVLANNDRIEGILFNAVHRTMNGFGSDLRTWETSMETNATAFFANARTF